MTSLNYIYISEEDFRTSNVRAADVGYNLYVFDIRYQNNYTASQPIKIGSNLMESFVIMLMGMLWC